MQNHACSLPSKVTSHNTFFQNKYLKGYTILIRKHVNSSLSGILGLVFKTNTKLCDSHKILCRNTSERPPRWVEDYKTTYANIYFHFNWASANRSLYAWSEVPTELSYNLCRKKKKKEKSINRQPMEEVKVDLEPYTISAHDGGGWMMDGWKSEWRSGVQRRTASGKVLWAVKGDC